MPRNYKQEYANYQGTEKQKKHRAERNKARRTMIREGKGFWITRVGVQPHSSGISGILNICRIGGN